MYHVNIYASVSEVSILKEDLIDWLIDTILSETAEETFSSHLRRSVLLLVHSRAEDKIMIWTFESQMSKTKFI